MLRLSKGGTEMVRTHVVVVIITIGLIFSFKTVIGKESPGLQSPGQQHLAQAQAKQKTFKYKDSRALYSEALAGPLSDTEKLQARRGLAIAQLECHDLSGAKKTLATIKRKHARTPGVGRALEAIARTYGAQGDNDQALQRGGNRDVTIKSLPGLNHWFQPCQTGLMAEAARLQATIAPEVLQEVGDWILKNEHVQIIAVQR